MSLASNCCMDLDSANSPSRFEEKAILQILIIDGDLHDRELYGYFLKNNSECDYRLIYTSTAEDGLAQFELCKPDCVLLEYHLPDSSGIELVTSMIEIAQGSVPIVMLTAVGSETIAADALKAGAADYIQKKYVSQASLTRAISNAIYKFKLTHAVQLQTRQIETNNKALRRKNEEIQRFYQTVSHELKTPLTSIQEAASILLDGVLGPINDEQKEFVSLMHESCIQMTYEVNDLIDITRLETGKYSINSECCNVKDIVHSVVSAMTIAAVKKNIRISSQTNDELHYVYADPKRCNQVLTNLVGNAIKFTQEGGEINVVVQYGIGPDSMIRITVKDNGRGIENDRLDMIFDRLYQTETHSTPGYDSSDSGGLGLGLSIAKQLVELQGGTISVSSEPGIGSEFVFTLPRYREKNISSLLPTKNISNVKGK